MAELELARALVALYRPDDARKVYSDLLNSWAQAMADDPVAFEQRCETAKQEELSPEARDAEYIRGEIARMDAELRAKGLGVVPTKTPTVIATSG